ncbi:MAG TPA: flagellar biosynthetic protein FliO [Spongiibacteraceae bacterium]|nr:flagellar biosynthetic protein FliO [Spongiibacteraceae bacterium]
MTRRCWSALLALATLYGSAAAHAVASATPPAASLAVSTPAVASNPFGLVAGLVFLLALVLVAAWLVKRSGGMQTWRAGASIKVVAALSLGPRERVVLIEAGGQQWLLGVAAGSITTLHHFEQPLIPVGGNAEDFSNKLRQFLPQGLGK